MTVSILTKSEFIKTHGTEFYSKFPTEESILEFINERIDDKINNSPERTDISVYEDNRELFIETMLNFYYRDKGYLHWLEYWFDKKLKLDDNAIKRSMDKQGKGIKFLPVEKSPTDNPQFKNSGADEGRRIITNLSYKEVYTCKKDKPVDLLTWDALNNIFGLKHMMRPAYWKNITQGDFEGPRGRQKAYDTLTKIVAMFCDKASIFNPKIYATIMNHYAPEAETSLHLVGSWCDSCVIAEFSLRTS